MNSAHLKHAVLGEGQLENNDHGIFLALWKKTMMKT